MKSGIFRRPFIGSNKRTSSLDEALLPSSNTLSISLDQPDSFSEVDFQKEELECLNKLKEFCLKSKWVVPNQVIYRFAIFHGFNVRRASSALRTHRDHPYLNVRLEDDLYQYIKENMVFFPLPGLKSTVGADVFYFRPSRYKPSASSNRLVVEHMCHVLNGLSQTPEQCRNGVLEIINLKGYSMSNFSKQCLDQLTKVGQGQIVPTRLVQILLVNPPKVRSEVAIVVLSA